MKMRIAPAGGAAAGHEIPASQRLGSVIKAEWGALWSPGGVRAGFLVANLVAIATGIGVVITLNTIAQEPSHVVVSAPIEAAGTTFAIIFGLTVAAAVGRDSDGRLAFTMMRTPVRFRLFTARAVSVTAVAMTGSLACAASVGTVAMALSPHAPQSAIPLVGAAVGVLVLTGGLMTLFIFALSTIAHRAVPAVLLYLAVVLLLPLPITVGAAALPSGAGVVLGEASAWTPAPLLLQAGAVSTVPAMGPLHVLTGLLGLLGWATVSVTCAWLLFARRDAS